MTEGASQDALLLQQRRHRTGNATPSNTRITGSARKIITGEKSILLVWPRRARTDPLLRAEPVIWLWTRTLMFYPSRNYWVVSNLSEFPNPTEPTNVLQVKNERNCMPLNVRYIVSKHPATKNKSKHSYHIAYIHAVVCLKHRESAQLWFQPQ